MTARAAALRRKLATARRLAALFARWADDAWQMGRDERHRHLLRVRERVEQIARRAAQLAGGEMA